MGKYQIIKVVMLNSPEKEKNFNPYIIPGQVRDLLKINVTEKNTQKYLFDLSVGKRFLNILTKANTLWEYGDRFDNPKF